MTKKNIIHVHSVLELLGTSKKYTIISLKEELCNKFGDDLQFKTCVKDSYDFEEILDFMVEKGKIVLNGGDSIKFISCNDNNCNCSSNVN